MSKNSGDKDVKTTPRTYLTKVRRLGKSVVLGIACALLSTAICANSHILVVLSSDAPAYKQVFKAFTSALAETPDTSNIRVTSHTLDSKTPSSSPHLQQPSLIIAVGSKATSYINKSQVSPTVLSVFITQDSWHKIRVGGAFQKNQTAIYLDQPYQRFALLCSLLPVNVRSLGAVFSALSLDRFKVLEHFSDANGLRLNARLLSQDDNPISVLEPLIKESDLFLALPDEAVFNQTTAKWILILGIKYKTPVIGFSKAYTNAGALAALHSTPKDTGKDAVHWVRQWLKNKGGAMLSPRFNRVFTLSTNPQVARSLGIPELNAKDLKQSLIRLEKDSSLFNSRKTQERRYE